ncbi:MAG TPA: hypothetical protein VMT16_15810 [Thermoanaerobaculia bacterium]|nr:hypothetical protein [Thermoanaerobaculia bacterium]
MTAPASAPVPPAQLWMRADDEWAVLPASGALDVGVAPPRAAAAADAGPGRVLLLPGAGGWALVAGARRRVRVDGLAVGLGLRWLADRELVVVEGLPALVFATEAPARVEPFPGLGRAVDCPRCRQPLRNGAPAVRCPAPGCGLWHHQDEELSCWSYAGTCAGCPQPTALDGAPRWTPEEL